ncbi:MAG: aspartyl-tRNA amidotransferase subunit B [Patescibacteria group bacterium]|nr:MAG: aspartyl-tRNA amidotransferase subunit B [Patescibacteria group bacterium]
MLKQKLKEELKQSMLARDEIKTSTLRMLLSAINYYEIQKRGAGYEATDEDVISVIQKEVKQRKDSIGQFISGRRLDLAQKEQKELEILQKYLPQQLDEDEISEIVDEAIRQTGSTSPQDIGKVMGIVMPKIKGKADGAVVSKIVRERLSQLRSVG